MIDSDDDFLGDLAAENKKAERGDDVSLNEDIEEEAKEEVKDLKSKKELT